MRRLALLNSESLLGRELKEGLGRRPELCGDLRLLSAAADAVGTVTEGMEGAALVQEATTERLAGVDLVLVCPGPDVPLPATAKALYVSPEAPVAGGRPLVAGVNLGDAVDNDRLVSPPPSVIALARLLHPLRSLGESEAVCWVLEPSSERGQDGIDELLEQTRSILSFRSSMPKDIFGSQLAFNLLPSPSAGDWLEAELGEILQGSPRTAVRTVQAAVFHSLAVGVHLRFDRPAALEELTELLLHDPLIDRADGPTTLGPIDVAGRSHLLLGEIDRAYGVPNSYWLWAMMDNLTAATENALAIVETIAASHN